jgi:hypothetical protein
MSILLEVSFAEAIDKLTILHIKKDKIKDDRVISVIKEYDYLYSKLEDFCIKYNYYYNILKEVNLKIWELQDIIRANDCLNGGVKQDGKLTEEILNLNDSRFIIKNKINNISKSNFFEQKGYDKRVIEIKIKNDLNDHIILNPAVRYLSLFYDKIIICVSNEIIKDIKNIYEDDITIDIVLSNNELNYDYLNYENTEDNRITHSYFKDNKFIDNKCTYNDIYNNLGLDYKICIKYKSL